MFQGITLNFHLMEIFISQDKQLPLWVFLDSFTWKGLAISVGWFDLILWQTVSKSHF